MEYRIRNSSNGGYTVDVGLSHKGGERIDGMIGVTMPAFIIYESHHFDTRRQAEAFIRRKEAKA